jgi:hypothetical protein
MKNKLILIRPLCVSNKRKSKSLEGTRWHRLTSVEWITKYIYLIYILCPILVKNMQAEKRLLIPLPSPLILLSYSKSIYIYIYIYILYLVSHQILFSIFPMSSEGNEAPFACPNGRNWCGGEGWAACSELCHVFRFLWCSCSKHLCRAVTSLVVRVPSVMLYKSRIHEKTALRTLSREVCCRRTQCFLLRYISLGPQHFVTVAATPSVIYVPLSLFHSSRK